MQQEQPISQLASSWKPSEHFIFLVIRSFSYLFLKPLLYNYKCELHVYNYIRYVSEEFHNHPYKKGTDG